VTYRGHVRNGIIVLDPPVSLPEGAKVEVVPMLEEVSIPTLAERYKDMIGIAEGLPADSAQNHDQYLYGDPKQ